MHHQKMAGRIGGKAGLIPGQPAMHDRAGAQVELGRDERAARFQHKKLRAEIAAGAVYWLDDATGPVSGCVVELEQYPAHGRNPDKVGL